VVTKLSQLITAEHAVTISVFQKEEAFIFNCLAIFLPVTGQWPQSMSILFYFNYYYSILN